MPKVKSIKFNIAGQDYDVNINVSAKTGLFTCRIPATAAALIGLPNEINAKLLAEVEHTINLAVEKYKEATITYRKIIVVFLELGGDFANEEDGSPLLNQPEYHKFRSGSFSTPANNELALGFKICVVKSIDGKETVYNTCSVTQQTAEYVNETNSYDGLFLKGIASSLNRGVVIPYTPEAYQTLCDIKAQVKRAANFLFRMLSMDADKVAAMLCGGVIGALLDHKQ